MILSRAPTRITLGGGGTDLASYYSRFGGFVIACAVNRYCHILATPRFYPSIRLLPELIGGDSIAAIDGSVAAAQELVDKVRKMLEASAADTSFPAGAPERTGIDPSKMSPAEKIAYGVQHAQARVRTP